MYYERYYNHYVVRRKDGSIYAHCDTVVECKEEIKESRNK